MSWRRAQTATRAVTRLQVAYAEGRFAKDEFGDRAGKAVEARAYGAIVAALARLPHTGAHAISAAQPKVTLPEVKQLGARTLAAMATGDR